MALFKYETRTFYLAQPPSPDLCPHLHTTAAMLASCIILQDRLPTPILLCIWVPHPATATSLGTHRAGTW